MNLSKSRWESVECEILKPFPNDILTASSMGNVTTTTKKVDIPVTDEGDF